MRPSVTYTIRPMPPAELAFLTELAFNLWWVWNHQAIDLFRSVDPNLWESLSHNPIKLLGHVAQNRLDELAADDHFLEQVRNVERDFRSYMSEPRWFQREHGE